MERLTIPYGIATFDPIDVVDNEYSKINFQNVLKKLADYEDAEEQGLLLRLPCKVGDTVYSVECGMIREFTVNNFEISERGVVAYYDYIYIGIMGNSVFATIEEAEQKLASMQKE